MELSKTSWFSFFLTHLHHHGGKRQNDDFINGFQQGLGCNHDDNGTQWKCTGKGKGNKQKGIGCFTCHGRYYGPDPEIFPWLIIFILLIINAFRNEPTRYEVMLANTMRGVDPSIFA